MVENVLITGASKGIGKAIAELLVNNNFNVYGTTRNLAQLTEKNDKVKYLQLDLSDEQSIRACVDKIETIDILINNAGQSQIAAFEEVPMDKLRALFEINYFGMATLTQLLLPKLKKSKHPKIINIGSMIGTFPLPFYSSYGATKACTQTMTYCLRHELKAFGIQVCIVEPNDIKTTITPDFLFVNGSEYHNDLVKMRDSVKSKMEKAHDPVCVSTLILKLIKKQKLKSRYIVGGMGGVFVFFKRFVPDSLVEYTVRKMYNLK
ncbi:MAG: SDR family NAD(P)-dependent oxidoreductase [Bacteroidales bacterium]|nr:SDR family NAD(P)-dependent oxidoreductase [Bacteroidales bacterium]